MILYAKQLMENHSETTPDKDPIELKDIPNMG